MLMLIKLWEWFNHRRSRIRANWFEWGRMADFFLRPATLKPFNFQTLFYSIEKSKPLKMYIENQEASYNFKLGFSCQIDLISIVFT